MGAINGNSPNFKPDGAEGPRKEVKITDSQKKANTTGIKALGSLIKNAYRKAVKASRRAPPQSTKNDIPMPSKQAPLRSNPLNDIPMPAKQAPLRSNPLSEHKAKLKKSRDEFVAARAAAQNPAQKEKKLAYLQFATSIAEVENSAKQADPHHNVSADFQREINEHRQILFAEFAKQVKTIVDRAPDMNTVLRNISTILDGASRLFDASALPVEKHSAVKTQIETVIGNTLVAMIKNKMPTSSQGQSKEYRTQLTEILREINKSPLSDETKKEIIKQIREEWQARFPQNS